MNWLMSLLNDVSSSAHIVFVYALVIVVGFKLGKIKFGSVSLGSTFVLFISILVGHLYKLYGKTSPEGYSCPADTLNFMQDFGLILFVYCIGLQVGPGFFSSFKKGGIKLNGLAVLLIVLNIAVMFGLYYLFFDTNNPKNLPMMVGVLCGAVTNTPALGAANETLGQVFTTNPSLKEAMGSEQLASAYACAYPLGVLGMIGATILMRYLLKISLSGEQEQINSQMEVDPHSKPVRITILAKNESLSGKKFSELSQFLGRSFVCSYIDRGGELIHPNDKTEFKVGDQMRIVCAEADVEAIEIFMGPPIEKEWELSHSPVISKRLVVTRPEIEGKTFGEMHFSSLHGVNVTRFTRSGMTMFADRGLKMQLGDRIMVVGREEDVNRVADIVGNSTKRLEYPNIIAIFLGILCGIVIGCIPFSISGIPVPIKLGIASGPLIAAILISRFGYKLHIISYTTTSVNMFVRELGLIIFLASVGLKAGAGFWDTLVEGDGIKYVWIGFIITVVPILIVGIIARLRYKLNYFTLMGLIAGSNTDPPLLGFANNVANNDAPAVGYSTVYPLSMFLRILSAQLIIIFCCS